MFKKNNFFFGFLLGAIAPLGAFLLAEHSSLGDYFTDKPLTLYAIAAVVNLITLRYFYKQGLTKSGGGMMAVTFLGLILLLLFKKAL